MFEDEDGLADAIAKPTVEGIKQMRDQIDWVERMQLTHQETNQKFKELLESNKTYEEAFQQTLPLSVHEVAPADQ